MKDPVDLVPDLTLAQSRVLFFLLDYTVAHFYQPSTQDMAKHLGCNQNNANLHVKALVRKGYLLTRGRARGLGLTDKGWNLLAKRHVGMVEAGLAINGRYRSKYHEH